MSSRILFVVLFVGILLHLGECQGDPPPRVADSYMASGEMAETMEDESKLLTQFAFDESFNAQSGDAAFRVYVMGKGVTFAETFASNQTFRYSEDGCDEMKVTDWIDSGSVPSLSNYEDTKGRVRFSLKQLLSLDDQYLSEWNVASTFRNLPARKWVYKIEGKEPDTDSKRLVLIYSYWSDPSWNASSSEDSTPLGFVVNKMKYKKGKPKVLMHETYINVFSFVSKSVDYKLFQAVQGVVCPGRVQTLKFPDFSNVPALSLHSEFLLPDYLEAKYLDLWLDTKNKLMQMDMERIKEETIPSEDPDKSRRFQTEIISGNLGVVFRQTHYKKHIECKVISFEDYEFDVQNIFNFKVDVRNWTVQKLFGLNETTYTYIGMATKRNFPCHVFQGVRTDWPHQSLGVTSLWEWCFSINMTKQENQVIFRSGEYGLVDARVTILKSSEESDFPPGFAMVHHFYHVSRKEAAELSQRRFQIDGCFGPADKRLLQFQADWKITEENFKTAENATTDFNFLQQWKSAIYVSTGLQTHSLRVSQLHSELSDNQVFVKFVILEPHNELPSDVKRTQITAFEAEKAFRDALFKKDISISYIPAKGAQALKISILKHSLRFQINHTYEEHEFQSTTAKPSSKGVPFSLETVPEPEETSILNFKSTTTTSASSETSPLTESSSTPDLHVTTSVEPTSKGLKEVNLRHGSGTIAGVSIAMLLVGISLGSMGIFVKYNGFPNCMKSSV